jgi:hypothetical protein
MAYSSPMKNVTRTEDKPSAGDPIPPKCNVPDLERQIEQHENFIGTLLGNNPGPIVRGTKLTDQPHAPEVPAP